MWRNEATIVTRKYVIVRQICAAPPGWYAVFSDRETYIFEQPVVSWASADVTTTKTRQSDGEIIERQMTGSVVVGLVWSMDGTRRLTVAESIAGYIGFRGPDTANLQAWLDLGKDEIAA